MDSTSSIQLQTCCTAQLETEDPGGGQCGIEARLFLKTCHRHVAGGATQNVNKYQHLAQTITGKFTEFYCMDYKSISRTQCYWQFIAKDQIIGKLPTTASNKKCRYDGSVVMKYCLSLARIHSIKRPKIAQEYYSRQQRGLSVHRSLSSL